MSGNLRSILSGVGLYPHNLVSLGRFCHCCHLFQGSKYPYGSRWPTWGPSYLEQFSKWGACLATSLRNGIPLSYHRIMTFYSLSPSSSFQSTGDGLRCCTEWGAR